MASCWRTAFRLTPRSFARSGTLVGPCILSRSSTAGRSASVNSRIHVMLPPAGAVAIHFGEYVTYIQYILYKQYIRWRCPMDPIRRDHLNLSVKDLDETIAWYGRVFGFAVAEEGVWGACAGQS